MARENYYRLTQSNSRVWLTLTRPSIINTPNKINYSK
jgi:hypothetical protein